MLLVATTVVEVGVDVPNASLMIIENAERMGLSQLHQLRGRVGRGACQQPLRVAVSARRWVSWRAVASTVLRDSNDGFFVAQRDLELRGPGELLGTRQTGLPQYRIADLLRDGDLMPEVQRVAGNPASPAKGRYAKRVSCAAGSATPTATARCSAECAEPRVIGGCCESGTLCARITEALRYFSR